MNKKDMVDELIQHHLANHDLDTLIDIASEGVIDMCSTMTREGLEHEYDTVVLGGSKEEPDDMFFEMQKTFVVSTTHITEEEAEKLSGFWVGGKHPVYDLDGYAWLIHVAKEDGKMAGPELPNVLALMEKAFELGCSHLRLDRDGPVYAKEFPVFDW